MVNMGLSTEILPHDKSSILLVAHIKSKNATERAFTVNQKNGDYLIVVKEIPSGIKSGFIEADELNLYTKKDLMPKDEDWTILPAAEFDDVASIILPKNKVFDIKVILSKDDDEVFAEKIIFTGKD